MSAHDLVSQFRSLNGFSPGFYDQLSSLLYGKEYKQWALDLGGDDLVWFVGYLDEVRRRVTIPHSSQAAVGSHYSRSIHSHVPEVLERTQKYMRHQGDSSSIAHDLISPSKPWSEPVRLRRLWGCVRRNTQWLKGLRQMCADIYQLWSTTGRQGSFLTLPISLSVAANQIHRPYVKKP